MVTGVQTCALPIYFDLYVGDTQLYERLLILPSYRFRGAMVDYENPETQQGVRAFYGRELNSILGTLSPTGTGIETLDSFVGGVVFDQPIGEDFGEWKMALMQASGQSRNDELNKTGMEFSQNYNLTDHWNVGSDIAFDSERFAHEWSIAANYDHWNMRTKYRDISKDFNTMIGNPSGQGEQGILISMDWRPFENIDVSYLTDIYRNREFHAEGERDRFNVEQEAQVRWQIDDDSALSFDVRDSEETAEISPFRSEVWGISYNRTVKILNHRFSLFTRGQHQDQESLENPETFYRRETLILGAQTPLFWDMHFSYQQNISMLDEINASGLAHPRSMTYTLSRSARIGDTPFHTDFDIRWVDEEETEFPRSFMIGEDRLEISGRVSYQLDNMEFYVDARYSAIEGENITNERSRSEAEIITGVRYLFDTNFRWEEQAFFHGVAFQDMNADGIQQTSEPGLSGLVVRVGDHEVTTDEQGYFKTPPVAGKRARIALDPNSMPYGYTGTTALSQEVPLTDSDMPVNFGLVAKSMILGVVFSDLNGNGQLDAGDAGIADVEVVLGDGRKILTNGQGRFRFVDASLGDHEVGINMRSLPTGYLPLTKLKQSFVLNEGVHYQINFPVQAQRNLTGRVYVDSNENQQFDKDEEPVAGAKVLFGSLSDVTDKEGYYRFKSMNGGTYTLTVHPGSVPQHTVEFTLDLVLTSEPYENRVDIPILE
jgi:hypothetical protein